MKFLVGNKIIAKGVTRELHNWCMDNLVLFNPDYAKKERMGLWTGSTPRNIFLYEKNGSDLILPFGCIAQLRSRFPDAQFMAQNRPRIAFNYHSHISLYPYQENAVLKALEGKNGILVMPCGAGKTQTGLEVIARIGGRALWLTHTQDLLNQSMTRAKSVFGCSLKSYGTITGGKVNIGEGITFATVQTMSKLDLTECRDCWDVIIVDECHRAIGSPTKVMQFYKVLSNLSCRYKFGLTATPKRADGLEKAMFALIGDVLCEVSKKEVANTTCPVVVITMETGYKPNTDMALAGDGTINYAGLVNDLTHDEKRMKVVSEVLNNNCNAATLVLSNRVEYLRLLQGEYRRDSVCLSMLGNSKAAKAERKEALRKLNDGEISCVFATYQLAKEGLDVPNLRYVVFATPEKDPTTIQQASGRVGRKADGKEFGTVIDFVDDFGMYYGWASKRQKTYRKLGYDLC